jgi:hypothetical protein
MLCSELPPGANRLLGSFGEIIVILIKKWSNGAIFSNNLGNTCKKIRINNQFQH